jgi:bifunctional non-homologous end joining protein LigD
LLAGGRKAVRDGPLEVDGHTVELSNTGKVLFGDGGVTKGDLVGYYRDVAAVMVPLIAGRPLTLQRFPDGVDGGGFFQQDASDHFPDWVRRVPVPRRGKGGTVEHVACDHPATLVYLANQATVTFHAWTSRAGDPDRPDLIVFDLDPPATGGSDHRAVRLATRAVGSAMDEIGLVPFVQTSGSKGFHVVAPIEPELDHDAVLAFTRDLAALIAARDPERLTVEVRKAKRAGRVFVDVGRNGYAQTAVAPYSVRARPGATVATPIGWGELSRVEPRSYTVANLHRRLARKADPWASLPERARPLQPARERLDRLASKAS